MHFDGADDYWKSHSALAGPVRATVETMSPDEVSAAKATLDQMLSSLGSDGDTTSPQRLVVVAAT